jgi:DNA repair protein SbcC/Rad50
MPSSSDILETRVKALQAYLAAVFPTATIRSVQHDTLAPITLLIRSHTVHGFALSTHDLRPSFEATYGVFKKLVVAGGDVRNLEPAFVFCIGSDVRDAEQFISSIETDVYFCRKFVVCLTDDIGASLAPLPFMPLAPIDGLALRPTSAQTFLQQSGLPALLAKQLVVPHERSAKRILDDCLSGKHGDPASLSSASKRGMREVAPSDSEVFLERVTIRNVRAYRKEQEFKLGQSLTVLYGPNGFGKTSFFDAIDFGMTGSIGRLPQKNDTHFRKVAQHLDSEGEDAYVSIVYNRNGERNTILRRVARRMSAELNGKVTDRKRILSEVTNTSDQTSDRVDNYISLFRATHLFSQEQQELTRNFHTDCELSTAVVSRMLAVEDYVSAKAKADEVLDQLTEAIASSDSDIATLIEEITSAKQQLDSLKAAATELPSPSAVQAEIAEIAARMEREELGRPDGQPDVDALRAQRAIVDGAIGQDHASLERLDALVEPVSEIPDLLSTQRSLEQQIAEKQVEIDSRQDQVGQASDALDAGRTAFALADRELAQSRKAVEDHTWFCASLPVYRDTERARHEAEEILNREQTAVAVAQAEEARVNNQIRNLESDEQPLVELLGLKQGQHRRLESLLAVLPVQNQKSQRIRTIVAEEQRVQATLNIRNQEWTVARSEVVAEEARADGLIAAMARVAADQERLVGLLDELEGHIADGICPVCGVDHGSKESLIRKIELRRTIDRSADLASALSECRANTNRLRDRANEIDGERTSLASQLRTLAEERSTLEAEVQSFVARVNEFAIDPFSTSSETSARQLHARMTDETNDLRHRLETTTHALADAQALHVVAVAAVRDKQAIVDSRKEAMAAAEAAIDRLRTDERWNETLAAGNDEDLQREASERAAQLETAIAALSECRERRNNAQVELEGLRRQAANSSAESGRLRTQLANTNRKLTAVRAALVSAQLSGDVDSAGLATAIDACRSKLGRLQLLRDSLIRAELALDASTTAASHVALQSAIREKEVRRKAVSRQKQSYQPWLAFFRDVCRLLQTQQAEAIGNFTTQYGPRTSIIQRRLRSVYSFDDIEIKEQGTSIAVRVRRGTEYLRPVDYFSQSQQQTLLLGLFLTACSSQTWSSFSSVFLDDPVTHFDDLNTYSLLDLVAGLLSTDSQRRQFIISTCDDKLLQLALRKFRYLGLAARFYRFGSIGRDGPVVTEIANRLDSEQPRRAG